MDDLLKLEMLKSKIKYLGYKKGLEEFNLNKSYDPVIRELLKLNGYKIPKLENMSLDEIKKEAVKFYEKYFDIHDISYIDEKDLGYLNKLTESTLDGALKAYRDYSSLARKVSPFDIPLELENGHSMVGFIRKPLFIVPDDEFESIILSEKDRIVPFSKIILGDELTKLSSATLIHEIAHAEQESNIGYTDSILNKEVISIFLEKLAALELDPTGELLKISERKRFASLLDSIKTIRQNILSKSDMLDDYIYVQSTLLAEKLFDAYLQERKQKKKDKYIYEIQDIFDGKKQVEDMLGNHEVTIQKGKDISLIKRHM